MSEWRELMVTVLFQLAVIIAAARAGAWVLQQLGQPQVVGEIVAGLVLGPSLLGHFFPQVLEFVFPPETEVVFGVISELGLVLLMFLIGLEFHFAHLKSVGRAALGVAGAGIVLPFLLGLVMAFWMHPLVAADTNQTGFVLIVAVALSITAIPILGRIMIELGIHRTRLGTLTITAAAMDDVLGWILLATVSALIHGEFQLIAVLRMILLTGAFVAGCWWVARPLLARATRHLLNQGQGDLTLVGLSIVLIVVFLSAAATSLIGIFSIFGPFVVGAALSHSDDLREAVGRKLREIVYALFLPIFFTYTGLHTNIGLLATWNLWLLCALVLAAATTGKVLGCGLAARAGGLSWRESGCVAVLMNTRALMGLIAINIGRELGVIPDTVFGMLVIMALVTTFLATPLLRLCLGDAHPGMATS